MNRNRGHKTAAQLDAEALRRADEQAKLEHAEQRRKAAQRKAELQLFVYQNPFLRAVKQKATLK